MRPLKPIRILVAGSLLSGLAIAIGTAAVWPDVRNARGITIAFVTGAMFGLLMFGPIAAGEALRSTFVRRHYAAFERCSAIGLAVGLGLWVGSGLGGKAIFCAWGIVFLAAGFRAYLSRVVKARR